MQFLIGFSLGALVNGCAVLLVVWAFGFDPLRRPRWAMKRNPGRCL